MTNRILYNGIKILVSNIGTKILGLINIILLSTFLSISDFGLFMLILTTINFVGLISTFSLQNVVYKTFVPVENKRTSKLNLANILMFSQISAIFFFCIINIFANNIMINLFHETNVIDFRILSTIILLIPLSTVLKAILVSSDLIKRSILVDIIGQLTRTVFLLILFTLNATIFQTAICYVFASMVTLSAAMYFSRQILSKIKIKFSIVHFRSIFKMGSLFFASSIGVLLLFNIDKIMLGILSNSRNVGYYILASTISNILLLTHQSFSTIFKPFAAVNFLKGNISILAKKYYELGKWSSNISGILFVFITFFPTYLISLFSNIENDHVFIVGLLLLSTSNFIYITIGQSTSLLQMIGGYKFEAINTFILIIINLILNLFLIPIYGAIGAAISTLIAVTVRVILQTIQIKNLIGLIVINQYQFIIFVLGLTLALASYKMVIYTEVKLILLLFCIVGLIYFLLTENSIDEFRSEIIKLLVHKK